MTRAPYRTLSDYLNLIISYYVTDERIFQFSSLVDEWFGAFWPEPIVRKGKYKAAGTCRKVFDIIHFGNILLRVHVTPSRAYYNIDKLYYIDFSKFCNVK